MAIGAMDSGGKPFNTEQEPWYRQFWPWFLIALPGSVVIAGLTTLYIANRHADDLVVDEYYKDGLAINQQLERQDKAAALGLEAGITILDRRIQVRLADDRYGETIQLRLSHPLEADRDFSVILNPVAPGLYVAEAPAAPGPNWHWTLDSSDGGWRLDGSLTSSDFMDSAP